MAQCRPRQRPAVVALTSLSLLGVTGAQAQPAAAPFPEPLAFPHQLPEPPHPHAIAGPAPAAASPQSRYEPQAQAQTKPMRVEVIDGSHFRDIETRTVYRLWGIDVCTPDQEAVLGRQPWPCGTMARAWLVNATIGKWVSCNVIEATGSEIAARCSSSAYPDMALSMLREGIAVALPASQEPKQIKLYIAAQEVARKAFKGLWGSAFDMPWAYRAQHTPRRVTAEALPADPAVGHGTEIITNNPLPQFAGKLSKQLSPDHAE